MQGAAYWEYATDRQLRGVISSRTRFPTIFERFSTRFGTAMPNPDLEPERAVNYELGWSAQFSDGLDLSTALFYADVEDMIQTVVVDPGRSRLRRRRTSATASSTASSSACGRSSRSVRRCRELHASRAGDQGSAAAELSRSSALPDDSAFVAFIYEPSSRLTITPSLELASDRWSEVTGGGYVRTGDYTLLNLQVAVPRRRPVGDRGRRHEPADENFELAHGYPEPGRNVYVRLRLNF